MKTVKIGICFIDEDDNIISKRVVGTNWGVDIEGELRGKFNIKVHNEIACILAENVQAQLTADVIKEMLLEIKDKK